MNQPAADEPGAVAPGGDDETAVAPATEGLGPPSATTPWWRRALPFLVAVGLVGWVLSRIDWTAFGHHLRQVNHIGLLAFVAVFLVVLLSADTLASTWVYRRIVPDLRFADFWVVRGASYLPSLLNHHLGQAWITWFLARRHGVELRRMAGSTLLVYATWGGCVLGLGAVAVLATDMAAAWVALPVGAGLAYLALLAVRPTRLAHGRILGPLFEAGVKGHLLAMAVRLPHLVVLFVGTWVPFLFFGVDVPLTAALGTIPIIMVAVTLPLTPLGVGTRDALAASFFAGYASGPNEPERLAAVAASTATVAVALVVVEAALGLLLLRKASRLMSSSEVES